MRPRERCRTPLRTWTLRTLRVCWVLLGGVSAAVLFATLTPGAFYALDLVSHFLPHALLTSVVALALSFSWKGRWALTLSGALCLAILGVMLAEYQTLTPGGSGAERTRTVRVAVYNAFARGANRTGNELDDVFRQWLLDNEVDLVCVVDPPWNIRRSGLWPGEAHLPVIVDDLTAHGRRMITLMSKHPLRREPLTQSTDPEYRLSFAAYHSVIVEFPDGGEALFTASHPRSPRDERAWRLSQRWLGVDADLIGAWRHEHTLPVIYAGDFNTTPTGRLDDIIVRKTGLRSPTRPYMQGTWPSHLPAFLALPIDRVYVSPGVRIVSARVGPRVYSDHRPVLYELAVPTVSEENGETTDAQNPQ